MTSTFPAAHSPGRHLEAVAIEVAKLAAALVRSAHGTAMATNTKSSPTDVVTATDVESESLIRRELIERCPGSTIVGEELADEAGTNAVGWIVDPIDGTVNFLYDLPVVSVSIAASVNGAVVAGAVADIVRGDIYSAASGAGARRDGRAVTTSSTSTIGQALVGTGFSYDAERRAQQSTILNRVLPACRDIRCMGSAALNLCWVGSGRLDAYYEHDTKPYDYAAGALIAAEAGATVELPEHNDDGRSIAASPLLFDDLRQLVTSS